MYVISTLAAGCKKGAIFIVALFFCGYRSGKRWPCCASALNQCWGSAILGCGSVSWFSLQCGSGSYLLLKCGSRYESYLTSHFCTGTDLAFQCSKASTFLLWFGSGSFFSLWCGSGSSFLIRCGSRSIFQKWNFESRHCILGYSDFNN